jgi:hypothetical protein
MLSASGLVAELEGTRRPRERNHPHGELTGRGQSCAVATPKIRINVERFSIRLYRYRKKGLETYGNAVCEECSRPDYFIPSHLPSFIRRQFFDPHLTIYQPITHLVMKIFGQKTCADIRQLVHFVELSNL